jgi:hypothetical protein
VQSKVMLNSARVLRWIELVAIELLEKRDKASPSPPRSGGEGRGEVVLRAQGRSSGSLSDAATTLILSGSTRVPRVLFGASPKSRNHIPPFKNAVSCEPTTLD